eukprot:UN25297
MSEGDKGIQEAKDQIEELKLLIAEKDRLHNERVAKRKEEEKQKKSARKIEVEPEAIDAKEETHNVHVEAKHIAIHGKDLYDEVDGYSTDTEELLKEEPEITTCGVEWWKETMHIGNIANLIALFIIILSFIMGAAGEETAQFYLFNMGLFAFSGGATNGIAIKMLFDKIPFLIGSGVIPGRFKEIRETVKKMIMKNFFDETYLNYYLKKKILKLDVEKMLDDLIKQHKIVQKLIEM